MSRGRGRIFMEDSWLDELVITAISPQEAASLSDDQFDIVRAHLRSEVLFSESLRKSLTEKAAGLIKQFK
jgi:hypothetical protein